MEVNATFHAIPTEATVRGWRARTPERFVFALKTPRQITHEAGLDLGVCQPAVERFLAVARLLEHKLGPILVQLPPSFQRTPDNRRALARYLDALPLGELRFAVELRHASWVDAAVQQALRDRNVAWVLADGGPNHQVVAYTADFAYVRWGRCGAAFPDFSEVRVDRSADLDWWAATLTAVPTHVQTVYGYMCDEFAGHAPASLRALQERLGLQGTTPRTLWPQPALF